MFDDFKNIRSFPANTLVYKDGEFVPELSTDVKEKRPDLPFHIIYTGKITGEHNWTIPESPDKPEPNQIFITARLETYGTTKITLHIESSCTGQRFDGKIIIKNAGNLGLKVVGDNLHNDTEIKCQTKMFAGKDSESRLIGIANIPNGLMGASTDIGFSVLCDRPSFLEISPTQRISSVPKFAGHSASIYHPTCSQIRYLETAGMTDAESTALLNAAFMEEVII